MRGTSREDKLEEGEGPEAVVVDSGGWCCWVNCLYLLITSRCRPCPQSAASKKQNTHKPSFSFGYGAAERLEISNYCVIELHSSSALSELILEHMTAVIFYYY